MNAYCNVYQAKAGMRRQSNAADTADDSEIARIVERVARHIDGETNRPMYAVVGTRYYQSSHRPGNYGPSTLYTRDSDYNFVPQGGSRRMLWLDGEDLVSASAITADLDADGTFETTLVADVDYRLWPHNAGTKGEPYRALELVINGAISAWPPAPHSVKVTGVFGYSYETEAVVVSGSAVAGTVADTTSLTITASASVASALYVGDTIVIGSEQMDVLGVSTTAITVTRGINGTTAASHTGAAILRRRFPRDIEEIAVLDSARLLREEQTGAGGGAGAGQDGYSYSIAYPRIKEVLSNYSAVGVI